MKKFSQKGFSLIEILLYMSLLSLIAFVAVDLFLGVGEFSLESSSKSTLQDDAKYITRRLSYDIHQASTITTPGSYGDGNRTSELQLELTLSFSPVETHNYLLVGNDLLYQRTSGGSTQSAKLNSNQNRLNFLWFSNISTGSAKPTIKILFELEAVRTTKQGPTRQTFETVVGSR